MRKNSAKRNRARTLESCSLSILMGLVASALERLSVCTTRTELGLRMALGAQPRHVVRVVLAQAMTLSFLGVMMGVAASFAAAPLLARFLYGVKPHDVLTLLSSSFIASDRRDAFRQLYPCSPRHCD